MENSVNVAYIGSDRKQIELLSNSKLFNISVFSHPLGFSRYSNLSSFRCLIVENNLPGVSGMEWINLSQIKSSIEGLIVFLISNEKDKSIKFKALSIGIDDIFDLNTELIV